MAHDVTIRPALEADLEAIQAIYAHHVVHGLGSFEEHPPPLAEMRRRFEQVRAGGYPYLAAEHGGRVVGYSYASMYRPRPAYRYSVENSVYVAPGRLKLGIGRELLSNLIEECSKGPWRQMIAVIGDSCNLASIALHRAHGFAQVGVLTSVGFKHGRWVDCLIMQRALGTGDAAMPA